MKPLELLLEFWKWLPITADHVQAASSLVVAWLAWKALAQYKAAQRHLQRIESAKSAYRALAKLDFAIQQARANAFSPADLAFVIAHGRDQAQVLYRPDEVSLVLGQRLPFVHDAIAEFEKEASASAITLTSAQPALSRLISICKGYVKHTDNVRSWLAGELRAREALAYRNEMETALRWALSAQDSSEADKQIASAFEDSRTALKAAFDD